GGRAGRRATRGGGGEVGRGIGQRLGGGRAGGRGRTGRFHAVPAACTRGLGPRSHGFVRGPFERQRLDLAEGVGSSARGRDGPIHLERQQVVADLDAVAFRHRDATCDLVPVDLDAVVGAQVLDVDRAILFDQLGVPA